MNLFGGMLMQWMDELAGIVARRHAGMTVTTASVDTLNFEAPAYQDDMVVLPIFGGRGAHCDEKERGLYFVLVAIAEDGKPVPVPGLIVENESERYEWMSGEKRYKLRKTRRKEGY